jgi:hypothetical protein
VRVVADAVPDVPAAEEELLELVDELPVPEGTVGVVAAVVAVVVVVVVVVAPDGVMLELDAVVPPDVGVAPGEPLGEAPAPPEEPAVPSIVTGTTVQ